MIEPKGLCNPLQITAPSRGFLRSGGNVFVVAHNEVYGTNIRKGVIFMLTIECSFCPHRKGVYRLVYLAAEHDRTSCPTTSWMNAFARQYVEKNMTPSRRILDDTDVFRLVNRTIKDVLEERAGDDAFLTEIIALKVLEKLRAEGVVR